MIIYIALYFLSHKFDLCRHNIVWKQASLFYEGG